jgi:hypothetical protein
LASLGAAGISAISVHKLGAANDLKPHLTRTLKLSNDPSFEDKFWDFIGLYLDPPDQALVLYCGFFQEDQSRNTQAPSVVLDR